MKHKILIFTAVFILVFLLLIKVVAPTVMKDQVEKAFAKSVENGSLKIDSLSVSILNPGVVVFKGVTLSAGNVGQSWANAKIETLTINLALTRSGFHQVVIDKLLGDGVDVTYSEGERKAKKAKEKKSESDSLLAAILKTEIRNFEFRYAHTSGDKTAVLQVHRVQGEISAFGTTDDLRDKESEAKLTGQIETSGEAALYITALTRGGPQPVNVRVVIEKQNLSDLNSFFTKNDGLVFGGHILKADATVQVRDQKSKAKVLAVYRDIEFKQEATEKTAPIEAALTTVGAALLLNKSNIGSRAENQMAEKDLEREKGEALVHFILRSLKETLLDVAKKKEEPKENKNKNKDKEEMK